MVFERKKIQIETLSEYLVSVRGNLKLSAEEVSLKTGISLKFLLSLESGSFKNLPADVYVLGFLRQLSKLYAVRADELINQYKKEKGIERNISKQGEAGGFIWYKKYFGKLVITPKSLTLIFGLLFVALTVSYIIWQVWSINKAPTLQVFQPANNSVIQGAAVAVNGRTQPGIAVSVNGQGVFVDSSGGFNTQLGLSPGPEQIIISATNSFGKSVSQTISLTDSSSTTPESSGPLVLKVDFTSIVTLGVNIDGQAEQTLTFMAGDSKTFTATQKITLSTSDAGATKITLNGQSLGAMGKSKQQLSGISFFAQPSNSGN